METPTIEPEIPTTTAGSPAKSRVKRPAPVPMTPLTPAQLAVAASGFHMASDVTRLKILDMTSAGEKFVGELCQAMGMSQPAVSHHLGLLRISGFVVARRAGKNIFYSATRKGVALASLARKIVAG